MRLVSVVTHAGRVVATHGGVIIREDHQRHALAVQLAEGVSQQQLGQPSAQAAAPPLWVDNQMPEPVFTPLRVEQG